MQPQDRVGKVHHLVRLRRQAARLALYPESCRADEYCAAEAGRDRFEAPCGRRPVEQVRLERIDHKQPVTMAVILQPGLHPFVLRVARLGFPYYEVAGPADAAKVGALAVKRDAACCRLMAGRSDSAV